jgi:flavin-dependent dehydrogenase
VSDVVIIGAGPAGLTLGCYLAHAGVPCLIVEKAHHPRPHVGESLMPAVVPILREIGFLEVLEAAEFPRSGGVIYHTDRGKGIEIAYGEFPQDGEEQPYTYHVDRGKFDLLLLKHAEMLGCKIVEGVTAQEAVFDDDGRVRGVRVRFGGQSVKIPAEVVADATGRATRIGRQLELRTDHPVLDQFALHAWFSNVDRGRRKTASYTHVFFLPQLRGWAWQAPINHEITSLGLVADKRAYQAADLAVEDFFLASLGLNPALARATAKARLLNDIKGEVNYSYQLGRVCGDGWLAVGDAARFIDPVFSSGVSVAMRNARSAAERIQAAVESGEPSRETLLPYEDGVLTSAAIWDDFIRLFYRLLPAFTHLLESPEHRPAMLRMIQGNVDSDSDAAVLQEMRSLVRSVEQADEHPWKGELLELPLR